MKRPRRLLSLLSLLLPASLLALSLLLLLLVCDSSLRLASTTTSSPPLHPIFPKTPPLLTLNEESLLPILETNNSSHLDCSVNGNHTPNSPSSSSSSSSSRQLSFKLPTRSRLLLKATARSKNFSTRAMSFFNGNRTSLSCKDRFFMTWISSSEAFGRRELFAVQSLFKSHRNACLLIVSNTMDSPHGSKLLKPFSDEGFRIAAVSPDFAYLFKRTPAQPWFDRLLRGEVDPGDISLGQNLSNLLRLALLYKYGGAYVDTDVIILRSLAGLKNSIGAQAIDAEGNWSRLNNAVMIFDKEHPLLLQFIQEFVQTFDGRRWGHNGPYLVSRVVGRVYGRAGFGVSVLQPRAFYPVDWRKIRGLFSGPKSRSHARWISVKIEWIREQSYALHLWNSQSRRMKVEEGSVIGRILLEYCCVLCNSSSSTF